MSRPTGPTPENSQASPPRGLPQQFARVFGTLSGHIQSLAELASLEGREAVARYVRMAIALGVGLLMLLFGYLFLVLFAAFAIATLGGVAWMWVALGMAVFHGIVAIVCVVYVKSTFRKPILTATREELRKDFAILRGDTTNPS